MPDPFRQRVFLRLPEGRLIFDAAALLSSLDQKAECKAALQVRFAIARPIPPSKTSLSGGIKTLDESDLFDIEAVLEEVKDSSCFLLGNPRGKKYGGAIDLS